MGNQAGIPPGDYFYDRVGCLLCLPLTSPAAKTAGYLPSAELGPRAGHKSSRGGEYYQFLGASEAVVGWTRVGGKSTRGINTVCPAPQTQVAPFVSFFGLTCFFLFPIFSTANAPYLM